jgi:hypothetical protein
MSAFDFEYHDHSDYIQRVGHYSRCEPHDATREEALLWRRVQELEKIIEEARPPETRAVLSYLETIPPDVQEVKLSPIDFVLLRAHAQDRVRMVVDTNLNQKRILGEMQRMFDGSPASLYLIVDRNEPRRALLPTAEADDLSFLGEV